jgi:putative ABC transport system permease protein
MDALAVGLGLITAISLGVVAGLAIRNRVLFRLGLRNAIRRPARTALIVLGLMLGTTIISAALATGDTMSHTIRSAAITSLGQTDELVSARSADVDTEVELGGPTAAKYFSADVAGDLERRLRASGLVDGVAPAIVEPVGVKDLTTRQSEPRVTLFASDPKRLQGFGDIVERDRGTVSLADLRPGEVYLNSDAADELDAGRGDRVAAFVAGKKAPLKVAGIVDWDGAGTDGAALMLPLASAQQLLGRPGQIRHVMISNRGDAIDGAELTDEVTELIEPGLAPLALEADPAKADALEQADTEGAGFMTLFTTFGSFSIAAGILLIFLIFVMLASERRSELGVSRALGMRRGHLVQMFLLEGVAYDLLAALVGTLLGLAVAFGMVAVLASALSTFGLDIQHDVQPRSVLIAYCIGVILTLVVVIGSAARVSRLNIVTAIRNLPEPPASGPRKRGILLGVGGCLLGALLLASGVAANGGTAVMLGVSLVIVSLVPLGRAAGAPERATKTAAGLALVVWWLLPSDVLKSVLPDLKFDISIFIVSGLMIVLGAAWTVMYNADALLGGVMWIGGRIRGVAPVLKMAISYPLRSLFRTGVTFTMFTLVVFTLVIGATTSGSFVDAFDDTDTFGGGFDVRADTAPTSPITDIRAAIARQPDLNRQVTVAASQSLLPVKARQQGTRRAAEGYPVRGLDERFLDNTTFRLGAMARGYGSAREVWQAMKRQDGLAVVDSLIVQRRSNYNAGNLPPKFKLTGFYLEDGPFDPVKVKVRDPQTGMRRSLTVIGVLKDSAPFSMQGISTSQASLAAFGDRAQPTVHLFKLAPEADSQAVAKRIESHFLENGMEADSIQKLLDDAVGASRTFNLIIQGFMGLGLVIGVAALGVIAARSVVERRQQIGVLRAIGFRRGMIQLALVLESSFLALSAILVGSVLGLILAYNVISDSAGDGTVDNLQFNVPWVNLAVIFLAVYLASLLATMASARRASRVYPAEALRYQ